MAYFQNIKGIYVNLRENKLGTCVDIDINISVFLEEMQKYKQTENTLYVFGVPRREIKNDNSTHIATITNKSTAKWTPKGEFTQRSPSSIGHDIDEDEEFRNSVLREFDDGEERPAF